MIREINFPNLKQVIRECVEEILADQDNSDTTQTVNDLSLEQIEEILRQGQANTNALGLLQEAQPRDIHNEEWIATPLEAIPALTFVDDGNGNMCPLPGVGRVRMYRCQRRNETPASADEFREILLKDHYLIKHAYNLCTTEIPLETDGNPTILKAWQVTESCKWIVEPCGGGSESEELEEQLCQLQECFCALRAIVEVLAQGREDDQLCG